MEGRKRRRGGGHVPVLDQLLLVAVAAGNLLHGQQCQRGGVAPPQEREGRLLEAARIVKVCLGS